MVTEEMFGGSLWDYVRSRPFHGTQQKVKKINLWVSHEGLINMFDDPENEAAQADSRGLKLHAPRRLDPRGSTWGMYTTLPSRISADSSVFQQNVFLDTRDGSENNVVIADFGLSVYVEATSKAFDSTRSGNPRYLAPEQTIALRNAQRINAGNALGAMYPDNSQILLLPAQSVSTAFHVGVAPAAIIALGVPRNSISPSARPSKESDLFSFAMLAIEVSSLSRAIVAVHLIRRDSSILGMNHLQSTVTMHTYRS